MQSHIFKAFWKLDTRKGLLTWYVQENMLYFYFMSLNKK